EERAALERETVDQSLSNKWIERRRKMLTASNFGKIIKMRQTTGCQSFVKNHLFGGVTTTTMEYGKSNEEIALRALEKVLNINIITSQSEIYDLRLLSQRAQYCDSTGTQGLAGPYCTGKVVLAVGIDSVLAFYGHRMNYNGPANCAGINQYWRGTAPVVNFQLGCGIFVDSENPYLGATPDGLIGSDGIVEVKCPSSAEHLTPEEVWTPRGIIIEKIERDEDLWKSCMVEKLKYFYLNCILPELADSRFLRSMPIRNPQKILDAQEKKNEQNRISSTIYPRSPVCDFTMRGAVDPTGPRCGVVTVVYLCHVAVA
ncbi:Exonuclease, partial [Aphis craccivora]